MKKITAIISIILCVTMLFPLLSFAGASGVTQNPDVKMPSATPVIDGEIEENGAWSRAADHSDKTAGYFWEDKLMTSEASLYFAYDADNLYFAADIEDCDAESGTVCTTTYDAEDYGFNGDVMTLMFDALGIFEKSEFQTTPWYNIGIYSDGSVGVYRTKINDDDITSSVQAKGAVTEKGWCFEIALPWSVIAKDVSAITNNALSVDVAELCKEGSISRASVVYLDRYKINQTWGRYITVCETTHDGYSGSNTNGTSAKSFGIILENTGAPEHFFGKWEITKEASCTEEGSRERKCTDCGETQTEVIEKLEHSFGEWETVKEATIEADGMKKRTCSVCKEAETRIIPAGGDQLIVAYFNASVGTPYREFTNIDVINYHPATINVNATSKPALGTIVTHDHTARYKNFKKLAVQQNPDIKFLFTVANNNLSVFESWFASKGYAEKLAQEMTIIIETYDYDGLDIDYEFPSDSQVLRDNFVHFMKCMRENLDNLGAHNGKEYYLSMAVPGTQWTFSLFDMNSLALYVDYFNMMNYDLYIQHNTTHHHTPTYDNDASTGFIGGSVYSDIQLYLERGIPANKIVPGCGLYALRYNRVPNINNGLYQTGYRDGTNLHYTDLLNGYINKNGFVRYWDEKAQAPYLYNESTQVFISYDDEQSVEAKCKVVAEQGVRGIMVFDYITTDGIGLFDNMRTWLDNYTVGKGEKKDVLDSFTDVDKEMWYAAGARYCVEMGYITGTDKGTFMPDGKLTREQFVVILARVAGADLTKYTESKFTDVKASEWYGPSVIWANAEGYVNGVGDGSRFGVGQDMTREQLATMFFRYAGKNGVKVDGKANLAEFTDAASIGSWATDACAWAIDAGLLGSTKTDAKVLAPQMTVTRAQAAKIFMSYDSVK
ncbi:MAG: S-layer homology domain-containing protein [Clostridia bacterium]|nr:S-layer homology domain-containing protein [Clostridia bacterium]